GEAGELAYELQRGGADLVVRRRRVEVEQRLDVAAHGPVSRAFSVVVSKHRRPTRPAQAPGRRLGARALLRVRGDQTRPVVFGRHRFEAVLRAGGGPREALAAVELHVRLRPG